MDTVDTNDQTLYHLYVKTHRVTGLKYLGYTKRKDPVKYRGSGTRWTNHIKKHGYHCDTEILLSTTNHDDIVTEGQRYSVLWNIVESDNWANLKVEMGEGGATTPEIVAKALETKRRNGTLNVQTPESIAKMLESRQRAKIRNNGVLEAARKMVETKRRNGTLRLTPECIARGLETKRQNGTMNSTSPESRAKALETKRRNGTLRQTPESIAKMLESRRRNREKKAQRTGLDIDAAQLSQADELTVHDLLANVGVPMPKDPQTGTVDIPHHL